MLPFQQNSPQMTFNAAVLAHNQGRFDEAEKLYRQILTAQPNQLETLFQMGLLKVHTQSPNEAIPFFEKASMLAPGNIDIWRALVDCMAGTGKRKQALRAVKRAKTSKLSPAQVKELETLASRDRSQSVTSIGNAPKAEVDQLNALFQSGKTKEALALATSLTNRFPSVAYLQNFLGVLLMMQQDFHGARQRFDNVVLLDPFFADGFSNLAKALLALDDASAALKAVEKALKIVPTHPGAQINKAAALNGLARFDEAVKVLGSVLTSNPDSFDALFEQARALTGQHKSKEALAILEKLDSSAPPEAGVFTLMADCLNELNEGDAAVKYLEGFVKKHPSRPNVQERLAEQYAIVGRFDQADQTYEAILTRHLGEPGFHAGSVSYKLSMVRKFVPGDPLISKLVKDFADRNGTGTDTAEMGFALAKIMEDTGATDKVFSYLNKANAAQRATFDYDGEKVAKDFAQVKNHLTQTFFESYKGQGDPDPAPIFIIGLPRGGSTLTDRIISRHPDVSAAGETDVFLGRAIALLEEPLAALKGKAGSLNIPQKDIRMLGEAAMRDLKGLFPDAPRISLKMLLDFVYLGLIYAALPNAKVVHVHRNPIDHCLSMLKNRFVGQGHRYTYDQQELAAYYCEYRDLMAHWHTVFPGQIIEVDYDKLVAEPEAQSKALFKALDLSWDPSVLEAPKGGTITTLSVFQARQPIFTSSVQGWKKYENELAPLIEVLKGRGVI